MTGRQETDDRVSDEAPPTVYGFGYRGRTIEELVGHVEQLGAVVVDVRYAPFVRDPNWSRNGLVRRLRHRYVWVQALGNKNYKSGPISLMDEALGLRTLGSITANGTPVILLCACADPQSCHRSVVTTGLHDELGWNVVELEPPHKLQQGGLL